MKLYDLKRGDKFSLLELDVKVPPDSLPIPEDELYTYKYVDGMYAPVTDSEGNTHYFAAWTEVIKYEVPDAGL
jgi:hypothetical protein